MSDNEVSQEQVIETPAQTQATEISRPEPTLRDELSHALKSIQEAPEGETAEARSVRLRDEQGKFTAKSDKTPQTERKTLTLPAKEGVQATTAKIGESAPKPVKAPDHWPAAAKAKFAAMDPELQSVVAKREEDVHKQFTAQDQDRVLGKKIRETAAPYIATIRAEGGTEEAAFQQFLNYAHIMRSGTVEQKLAALHNVAQIYKVPLGSQLQPAPQNQLVESLQQRLQRLESEQQAANQQRQLQEQTELYSTIEDFAAAPGHDHFDTVRELMGSLLQSGQAKDMQDAYDKAIWANPEIRSTLTAAQIAAANEKRVNANQQKTGAAKWAAGSITGGPGGAKAANGAGVERSLGDELRANWRAATSRV